MLQSEILDLKASYSDKAKGVVIESKIDKGKGPVSTILISNGKFKRRLFYVAIHREKLRAMINYDGKTVDEALPSMPVEILGMNSSAYAGAEFLVTKDEEEAKKLMEFKKDKFLKTNCYQKIKQLYLIKQKIKTNLTLLLNLMCKVQARH